MYLYTDDIDDYPVTMDPDKIKVMNEEVLTFWLSIPPIYGTYKMSEDVMVDRAEIGVEWQNKYDPYCPHLASLNSHWFSKTLYDSIGGSPGLVWFKNFEWHDLDAKKEHWTANGDSAYTDSVDLTAWAGHGWSFTQPMHFFKLFGCVTLSREDMNLGDTDADWVVIYSCYSLYGSLFDLKMDLLNDERCPHLFCGFTYPATPPYFDYVDAGWYFAQRLKEKSIKKAWFDHCKYRLRVGAVARVFGADYCMYDSLKGPGPIETSRDPTFSDNWVIEDYEKPPSP